LRLGTTAFGGLGPAVALLERELVQRRRALTSEDIAEALAFSRLLPGSSLVQVVSFLGYRLAGWSGATLATIGYLLPAVTAMLVLAFSTGRSPRCAASPQGLVA
jgi:chromate transporter